MKLSIDISCKSAAALRAGELVSRRIRSTSSLAIVLEDPSPRELVLGYLAIPFSDQLHSAILVRQETKGYFLSYGHNWIIEPVIGPETYIDNLDQQPGALILSPDGPKLHFAPAPNHWGGDPIEFNIETRSISDTSYGQNCAPVHHWKLWSSIDAKQQGQEKPLLTF